MCIDFPEGGKEILCTSILDKKVLAYEDFAQLYHYRWNVEEGYKLLKARLDLEAFTGKTAIAVRQDFYAKIFTLTTVAVCAFPIDEHLKKEVEANKKKSPKQVNRTNALAMVKEIMPYVLIKRFITSALRALDKVLRATTEIIRPNRKFKRKKIQKKPPSMNYKRL